MNTPKSIRTSDGFMALFKAPLVEAYKSGWDDRRDGHPREMDGATVAQIDRLAAELLMILATNSIYRKNEAEDA